MQIRMDTTISFWAIVLLLTVFIENSSSVAKKLNASQAFDDTWSTATDLENELEQKRAGKGSGSSSASSSSSSASSSYTALTGGGSQWSGWSEWSTCSRTCDGGIMQQMRRCFNQNGGCKGDSTRFRICNMQPCPEQQDFRADQCAAYNDVPYDGTLYRWTPHYDYVEPCALTCRGRPAHLSDDVSPEADGSDDSEHYEEPSVIVQLSARVQDGTRCRSGSLDMCIQGKCQRVGCDLKIGSTKKVDGCGVCGGDGSSCTQPLYQWEMAAMSQCSVTCGGGYKMSQPVCKNRLSGGEVDDSLCNAATRPEQAVLLCNSHTCPPRWIADEWSLCSRLCGHGYRERMVVCAEENDGVKTRVSDIMCRTPKPSTQETCLIEDCPKWEVDEWTGCSVSCGQGIQMRGVECKSGDGSLSAKCDPLTKPSSAQQCSTGIPCDGSSVGGGAKQKGNRMSGGGKIIIGSSGPLMSRDRIEDTSDMDEEEEEDDEEAEEDVVATDDGEDMDKYSADGEPESLSYNDQPLMYAHHQSNRLHQEELPEPRTQFLTFRSTAQPSAEPTFIKDNDWSPCSVTCGEGIRRRPYKCKIFLEYSRTVATVNDTLCEGPKPHDEVERCVEEPCMLPSHGYDEQYPRDSIKVGVSEPGKTYVWREQGYTSCSASCLGGVEELIINCVREDNGRVVSPFLCAPETKPEARVRTCNDRPCPPRWNYSDYTPCSKSCGIGIKTREVQCIHEVTRGGENTMVVPNSMCPQPPPADRQYCNVLDCPVRWEVGEWSKCSHTCGYGIKERKVECKQIMAQEHKIERPETMCPSAKPPDKKPCNVKPCPPEDPKPIISISNTTHIQHDPKKSKITLKVGGAGVVFFGTQVKIKCPVKRYNRTKIKWSKDHKPLARSRKFKVSKKGALRILDITFRDAGVYSCHAGLSSAEIQIEVKAKPGQQAEDLERQDLDRLVRERSGSEPLTSADMTAADALNSTQSTRRKQQSGRERNRRPKTDVVQHRSDGSVIEDEHSQLVQQQAQDGLPQPASANSGGSRTRALLAIPYFQALLANLQYLWPFQKYNGNSRSHQNALLHDKGLQYGIDFDQYEQHPRDEPLKVILSPKSLDNAGYEATAEQPNAHDAEPSNALTSSTTTTTTTTTTTERQHETDENAKEEEDFVEGRIRTGYEESGALSPPHGRWQGRHWAHTNTEVADVGDAEDDGDGDDATTFGYITNFRPNDDDDDSGVANAISTYKWLTSEWSPCTQKCGEQGVGLRRRSVTCVRIRKAYFRNRQAQAAAGDSNGDSDAPTMPEVGGGGGEVLPNPVDSTDEIVANVYCADYGLSMPPTFETCGYGVGGGGGNEDEDAYDDPCPRWTEGPWSLCQQSRCFERNTAIQRREVQCRYANRTVAPGGGCDENVKPISRQECFNERCKGVWRVEPWSECNAPCGRQGIKYRILQCVWYGTRRPAGNACKHQPRPPVMKVCKSAPCLAKLVKGGQCKDSSRYCRNVRTMGLCRLHRYKEKCCKSCKLHLYNK